MTRKDQASPVEPGTTVKGAGHVRGTSRALYTAEERVRRDESVWTIVQGVLAPLQFLVFLVSLGLVLRHPLLTMLVFLATVLLNIHLYVNEQRLTACVRNEQCPVFRSVSLIPKDKVLYRSYFLSDMSRKLISQQCVTDKGKLHTDTTCYTVP